jgi:hypothetical protein
MIRQRILGVAGSFVVLNFLSHATSKEYSCVTEHFCFEILRPHRTFRVHIRVKLIRGSNDLGIHRSTTPLQGNVGASQFVLQVRCKCGFWLPLFSDVSALQAAKGAPNNSPTEPYNPAAYQSSMPPQFGTAFVPHHSQASMQPIGDTDRTRQILEVPS